MMQFGPRSYSTCVILLSFDIFTFEKGNLEKGKPLRTFEKGMGKGGARHFKKPFIEAGLLLDVLSKHADLVKDFKIYEFISAQGAADPRGLLATLDLVEDLLELSPSCELHSQPLRNSLLRLLTIKPALNSGLHNGSDWVHQRTERITVILGHIRRLARTGMTSRCASELTAMELQRLTKVMEKVEVQPLENGEPEAPLALENGDRDEPSEPKQKRKLKEQLSLDSEGYPMILKSPKAATPEKVNKGEAGPSRLLQKRGNQGKLMGNVVANPDLREELALGQKTSPGQRILKKPAGVLKKPAAAAGILKKPAAALQKAEPKGEDDDNRPWLKLSRTNATKPERSYLLGTKNMGEPAKLIVKVSRARSKQYRLVITKIHKALEEHHLSKKGAIALREELCLKYQ